MNKLTITNDDEKVSFNFQSNDRATYKIKVRCNKPDCNAERNVYISAKIIKWGEIKNDSHRL